MKPGDNLILKMDPQDHLALAKAIPGEDNSWLAPGWLQGSKICAMTRSSVVDWLVQVQQYLSLSDTTLHLAVANFDLVISLLDWDTDEIQLLGLRPCMSPAGRQDRGGLHSFSFLIASSCWWCLLQAGSCQGGVGSDQSS